MVNVSRFLEVRRLLIEDKVKLVKRGNDADFFEVGEYSVIISDEKGVSCTCPYGSIWGHGRNKHLPCKHILSCLCSYVVRKHERKQ